MSYITIRSVRDSKLLVVFTPRDGSANLNHLPDHVRNLSPWQVIRRGDETRLRPHYRLMLAEQMFALIYSPVAGFTPEV